MAGSYPAPSHQDVVQAGQHTLPESPEWGAVQVGEERQASFRQRQAGMLAAEGLLDRVRLTATAWKRAGIPVGDGGGWHTAAELLARAEVSLQQVPSALRTSMPVSTPQGIHQQREF